MIVHTPSSSPAEDDAAAIAATSAASACTTPSLPPSRYCLPLTSVVGNRLRKCTRRLDVLSLCIVYTSELYRYITCTPPALHTIAAVVGVHLSTFLNSDTLDSQAINAIFHTRMTVVSGGNVCGLATTCCVELFVCLGTSVVGRQACWFHSQAHGRYPLLKALHYAPQASQQSAWVMCRQR